ncbi:MAG: hypothetical protein IJP07_05220 [Firmicutes bacterium]|nr:hypothetical protein [Bacillota bacterium]
MDYGLIGYPLGHSMSPQIHALLEIPDYELHPLPPEDLEGFLRKAEFKGVNVTIPYKKAVLPYCDFLSPQAQAIGSVNTLIHDEQGQLCGYNTDYAGLELLAQHAGISFSKKHVVIFGTGGAALTAWNVAKDHGAESIQMVSRRGPIDYENIYSFRNTQILINATPVGMSPRLEDSPICLSRFPQLEAVLDLIYNPLRSRLLLEADALGLENANGLLMLAHQAKLAEELFLGKSIPDSSSFRATKILEKEMTNIALIGMPGCGKSTVAQQVAELTGRSLVDVDRIITERSGRTIPQIFQEEGEAAFRRLESAVLRELADTHAQVIACGGGAVLAEENRKLLRQNGRIYLLESDLSKLDREGRPLSASWEALQQLARDRKPIYEALADVKVWNDQESRKAAERIKEDFDAHFGN